MSKRLLSFLLALLFTAVVCCSPILADESSAVSTDASSTVSETSATSGETSATSGEASATSGDTSGSDTEGVSQTPWGLFAALFLIVCFVVVCLICIKTENRFGVWLAKHLRNYISEFKKISWLAPKELLKQTGVTLVILIVAAIVLGLLDWGFSSLIKLLALL